MDAHGWLALIAPRPLLIHTAHQDGCEPTFAVERAYLEGRKVYELLGKSDNLRVVYREGSHNPITEDHCRQNIDWFDLAFKRGTARIEDFPVEFMHRLDWGAWKSNQGLDSLTAPDTSADIKTRIGWMFGEKPNRIPWVRSSCPG